MAGSNEPVTSVDDESSLNIESLFSRLDQYLEQYDEYIPLIQLAPGLLIVLGILGGAFAIVVFYSLLSSAPLTGDVSLTLQNYQQFLTNDLYLSVFWDSLLIAVLVTVGCILVAFPVAYRIAFMDSEYKNFLLILCVLPFWINLVVRTYAWRIILNKNGVINYVLLDVLGVIDEPLQLMFTEFAVSIGLLHVFLPFAIIPLYTSIAEIDQSHVEAAKDLGANKLQAFYKVSFPQALPGIGASSIIVFVLAFGSFVIPNLLGGSNTLMIGNIIANMFTVNFAWELGAAIAVVFTVTILVLVYVYNRVLGLEELYGTSGGEAE